jgi:predicted transcriptional regulator
VALPSAWTESSLLTAIEAEVELVSTVLGLLSGDTLLTVVSTDVPSVLGISSVEAVTYSSVADVVKVLTIAKWRAWVRAYEAATVLFDVKAGTVDVKQSQIFKQIAARMSAAESDAGRYSEVAAILAGSIGYAVVSEAVTYGSPYRYPPDEFGS